MTENQQLVKNKNREFNTRALRQKDTKSVACLSRNLLFVCLRVYSTLKVGIPLCDEP